MLQILLILPLLCIKFVTRDLFQSIILTVSGQWFLEKTNVKQFKKHKK